jgi:multiple sugar transport system permease protein/raffinose/stachyose/melibiose transport system permease protein
MMRNQPGTTITAYLSRKGIVRLVLLVPLFVYTLFAAGPFLWTAILSLRKTPEIYQNPYGLPTTFDLSHYVEAFTDFGYALYMRNSLIVTIGALILITLSASMAAYIFARARFNFPLREPLFLLIFLTIMFPPQIMILALFQILIKIKLYNTHLGLILVYAATELPLAIYLLRAFYAQIPQEIEDAARIDGCSDFMLFRKVMFPIARPAVSTVLVLNLIRFWNEFLYASVLITKKDIRTLPLAIMFFMGEQYQDVGMLATGLMISSLPIIILYVFLSEQFIKGMTAGALKM